MTKEEYINLANEKYTGNSRDIMVNQIEKFYKYKEEFVLPKHPYKVGDDVLLKKGSLMHGAYKNIEALRSIVKDGLLSTWLVNERYGKHPACAALWNLKWDISLKDYINYYSGCTAEYNGYILEDGSETVKTEVIPYDKMSDIFNYILTINTHKWMIEQTKEARFLPSLQQNRVQIGFVFNSDNDEIRDLLKGDVLNPENINDEDVKEFINEYHYEKFIKQRLKKDDFFTDRESAILFGIPSNFIEGIMVGRIYEKDDSILKEIKELLPNAYICNLDGKVIVE